MSTVILHVAGLGEISAISTNGFSDALITDCGEGRGLIEAHVQPPVTDAALAALVEHAEAAGLTVERTERQRITFDVLLDEHLAPLDSYVAPVEAGRFRDWLLEHHPDALSAWRDHTELAAITDAIRRRDHSQRTKARRRASARQFHEATDKADLGDPVELEAFIVDSFSVVHVVDEENTRKRVADMVGTDHLFVAGCYQTRAKRELMLEAFHRAVGKKVGKKRTADVMSVEQYEGLYRSITGEQAA